MTKVVNIYPKSIIYSLNPPIRFPAKGVTRTVEDIYKCMVARAIVDEVLSDGSTIRLTFANYDKDNTPKVEEPKKEETPIAEPVMAPAVEQQSVTEEPKKEEPSVEEKPVEPIADTIKTNKFGKKRKSFPVPAAKVIGTPQVSKEEPKAEELETINIDELNIQTIDAE